MKKRYLAGCLIIIGIVHLSSPSKEEKQEPINHKIIKPEPGRIPAYYDWKNDRYVYEDELNKKPYTGPPLNKPRFNERKNDIIEALEYWEDYSDAY